MRMRGVNSWGYITGNVLTTRPTANFGTAITPGNNTYGSYTSILSGGSIARDCYWLILNFNSVTSNTLAKDCIVTIGMDSTGGTAYQTLIPDLLVSCASVYHTSGLGVGGVWYCFPLFVPAGAQLAAKASVNNATVGTVRVAIWLHGAPSRPDLIACGTSVEAIGINTGSSSGTSVTSGTTSDGAWTSLGTTARRCFFWQLGVGINDPTMSNIAYTADLSVGDGSNLIPIIHDRSIATTNLEAAQVALHPGGWLDCPAGATLYGRMQCGDTADSGLSLAAYGVRL